MAIAYGGSNPGSHWWWLTVNPTTVPRPDTAVGDHDRLRHTGQIGTGGCTSVLQSLQPWIRSWPSAPDVQNHSVRRRELREAVAPFPPWIPREGAAFVPSCRGRDVTVGTPMTDVAKRTSLDLEGRSALVTGGAGGLGAATVGALVGSGVGVVIFDRDGERASALSKELGDADGGRGR